jgi:hypothetical protein
MHHHHHHHHSINNMLVLAATRMGRLLPLRIQEGLIHIRKLHILLRFITEWRLLQTHIILTMQHPHGRNGVLLGCSM